MSRPGEFKHRGPSYGLEELGEVLGWPPPDVADALNLPHQARLTEAEAELAAVKLAKRHPFEVWPEMVDHVIADCSIQCQRPDCGRRYVPFRRGQRWCSDKCRDLMANRRAHHRHRDQRVAAARAYYRENRAVLLAKQKVRDDIRRGKRAAS